MEASPAIKPPLTERINLRILVFLAVVLLLIGFPLYRYLETALTGGIVRRGDYTEVDLKAISDFEMDPTIATDKSIPKPFRELDGKRVQLVGEMWVGQSAREQNEFDLVYSIQKCCFTGAPKIQHFVKSRPAAGKTIQFHQGLVKAIGTLHVGIQRDELGNVQSVYRFEVESLEPYNG